MGKSTINEPFSIAMLNYQRVAASDSHSSNKNRWSKMMWPPCEPQQRPRAGRGTLQQHRCSCGAVGCKVVPIEISCQTPRMCQTASDCHDPRIHEFDIVRWLQVTMCHPVLQSYMSLEVASGQGEIEYDGICYTRSCSRWESAGCSKPGLGGWSPWWMAAAPCPPCLFDLRQRP